MSRLATPYDNAQAESFMKTPKYEEVYRTEYRDLEEARLRSSSFWRKSTTSSACIRRWAIVRRWSSNAAYDPCERWGKDEYEFFEA
jgi:hypothetical protein